MVARPAIASVLVREQPNYRQDALLTGLRAAGYDARPNLPPRIQCGDVLVIWNRYGKNDELAWQYEAAGGKVLVVENGYLDRARDGSRLYAIALNHHNGAGLTAPPDAPRWPLVDAELAPWRADGRAWLLLPQRGIGAPGVAMPRDWLETTRKLLKRNSPRPIRTRPHPGRNASALAPDLKDVWAVVTWGSGAAIKAACAGVPVFYDFPLWIGAGLGRRLDLATLERPFTGDRMPALERIAHAQWSVAEIQRGLPFERLLGRVLA